MPVAAPSERPTRRPGPLDQVFDMLSHRHRRAVLRRLELSSPCDVSELWRGAEGDDVDRISIELHHVHLPKLAAAGFIEWDRHRNIVGTGPRYDEVVPVLTLVRDLGYGTDDR